jgi:hypothetical protein
MMAGVGDDYLVSMGDLLDHHVADFMERWLVFRTNDD